MDIGSLLENTSQREPQQLLADFDHVYPRSKRRAVTNFKEALVDDYQRRRLPKKRGASSVDDLYNILFYHWVYDNTVYRDELQRCYVATGILMASCFGCRSISMFDTRIKFEDEDDARKSADHPEDHSDNLSDQDGTDRDDEQATLLNSDSDLDHDDDTSACSDNDADTDTDSGTYDRVDAGFDDTGSLLWRRITFSFAPHRVPGEPNLLFAKVTITHTEGKDNCPREKTYIVGQKDKPLLCLLDHLLCLALHDDVFAAESLRNLKKERSALDIPVFREPGGAVDGYCTSPTKPLRSKTWLSYLTQLGRRSRLEKSFTQYCARRALVNAINNKAPSSVRDQILDHQSNTVRYYLNREVRFNTIAAFLGRPSIDVVQKLARLMTLIVDPNAPTKLSPELSKQVANSKRVVQLSRESKVLTEKVRRKYGFVGYAPPNDPLLLAKTQANTALHREENNRRNRMLEKAWKRYLRNADTSILEAQFADSSIPALDKAVKPPASLQYYIPERSKIVRLTCEPMAHSTDHRKHTQRLETLRARVACDR